MNPSEDQIFDTVSRFAQGYQKGNLQQALSQFSSSAKLVAADGQCYAGIEAIRCRLVSEIDRAVRVVPRGISIQSSHQKGRFQSTYDLFEPGCPDRPVCGHFTADLSLRENRWMIDNAQFALAHETTSAFTRRHVAA